MLCSAVRSVAACCVWEAVVDDLHSLPGVLKMSQMAG